jgi:hypothetical protein
MRVQFPPPGANQHSSAKRAVDLTFGSTFEKKAKTTEHTGEAAGSGLPELTAM